MPSRIWIKAGPEFMRTVRALGEVDGKLPGWLKDAMREAVRPAVERAKARVQSMPVQGKTGSTGLRRRVARGVVIQANTEGGPLNPIRVATSMDQPDERSLPGGLDRASGWRHPVFGNRDVWVQQRPMRPGWFSEPMEDAKPEIQRALEGVLEDAAEHVDRAS